MRWMPNCPADAPPTKAVNRWILASLIGLVLCQTATAEVITDYTPFDRSRLFSDEEEPEYEATENYSVVKVGGFTILVSGDALYEQPENTLAALWVLRSHIVYFNHVVKARFDYWATTDHEPSDISQIYTVKIWLDDSRAGYEEGRWCEWACYLSASRSALEARNINPDKHLAINYTDLARLIRSKRSQDGIFIHELAHAWHHQFIPDGFNNQSIATAYQNAKDSGKYDEVMDWWGNMDDDMYAMTNVLEFLAEFSESYWNRSYNYPFNFGELKSSDKDTYITINDSWLWLKYGIRTEYPDTNSETNVFRDSKRESVFFPGTPPRN